MDSIFQSANLGIEEISKSIDFDTAIFYIFGTQFFLIICGMIVMVLGESLLKSVTAQGLFFGGLVFIIPYFSTLITILLVILMDATGVLLLRSSMSKRAYVRKKKQAKGDSRPEPVRDKNSQPPKAKTKPVPKEVIVRQSKRVQGRSFQSKGNKQRRKTSHRKSSNARRKKDEKNH